MDYDIGIQLIIRSTDAENAQIHAIGFVGGKVANDVGRCGAKFLHGEKLRIGKNHKEREHEKEELFTVPVE
jgi:hypothetical protein